MKMPRLKRGVIVLGMTVISVSLFWFMRKQLIKRARKGSLLPAEGLRTEK